MCLGDSDGNICQCHHGPGPFSESFPAAMLTIAPKLWVPETLHTSCDLLILVDQPAEPVASSDVVDLGCCAVGEWS